MGKVTRERVVEVLTAAARKSAGCTGGLFRPDQIAMYADSFVSYQEAADNIRRNGEIVFHPRTGAPIENPYIAVRTRAMSDLRKFGSLDGSAQLWLEAEPAPEDAPPG